MSQDPSVNYEGPQTAAVLSSVTQRLLTVVLSDITSTFKPLLLSPFLPSPLGSGPHAVTSEGSHAGRGLSHRPTRHSEDQTQPVCTTATSRPHLGLAPPLSSGPRQPRNQAFGVRAEQFASSPNNPRTHATENAEGCVFLRKDRFSFVSTLMSMTHEVPPYVT